MKSSSSLAEVYLARTERIAIRRLRARDLEQVARFAFTVSITEPLTDGRRLAEVFAVTGLWEKEAGAVGIVDLATDRLVGTSQFYRSAPCIHGIELGYVLHERADRGRGLASPAVRLFSDFLFGERPDFYRQQLMIEVWNTASWRLAERCGFVREGLLRSSGFGNGDPAGCFIYSRTRKDFHEERHAGPSLGGNLADP
ncbi:MAG: GNAT family N-acetyltransferase [Pseudomonadota bacterium]|nr:GNAT family N-acetyltransferase [Pseudomonadota bacterium]